MKPISKRIAFVAALGLTCVGAMWAVAQEAKDPLLARVDGVEIRESDLALAEADIGESLPPTTPQEARRDALLNYLVDVNILANAAEAKKVAQGPDFERKMAFMRKKILMEALLQRESSAAASEAEMKKLYQESVGKITPEDEVHARHILVETEDKAKEILAKLKAGGDFAELAKQESKDPGSASGGDLGFFTKGQMVPEFAEAAFAMKKGELSAPVKSQFGWHIIRVEDRRPKEAPSFDQVKDQIEAFLVRRAQSETVLKAREEAKVEKLTEAPKATPEDKAKKN